MTAHLLPANHTPLEVAFSQTAARLEAIPSPLRALWTPETCPADLLPHLAQTLSLPIWRSTWSDTVKRRVIRATLLLRARAGAPGTVEEVLGLLGWPSARVEEPVQAGRRLTFNGTARFDGFYGFSGTAQPVRNAWALFRVSVSAHEFLTAGLSIGEARDAVEAFKRYACHLVDLTVRSQPDAEAITPRQRLVCGIGISRRERWREGLRFDGTARFGAAVRARFDGARAFDGGFRFDAAAVRSPPTDYPAADFQGGVYPERRTLRLGLTIRTPAAAPLRFDGTAKFSGSVAFAGRLPLLRDGGLRLGLRFDSARLSPRTPATVPLAFNAAGRFGGAGRFDGARRLGHQTRLRLGVIFTTPGDFSAGTYPSAGPGLALSAGRFGDGPMGTNFTGGEF